MSAEEQVPFEQTAAYAYAKAVADQLGRDQSVPFEHTEAYAFAKALADEQAAKAAAAPAVGPDGKPALVEMRSGPFFNQNAGSEGHFSPKEFVTPGEDLEDVVMRSSMSSDEAGMMRLITSGYLANVCGVVMPIADLRLFMLSTSSRRGQATGHMRDVAIAAMAGAAPQNGQPGAPAEVRGNVIQRFLGLR